MIIKPHLVVGAALLVLLEQRWRTVAAATVALSAGLSTWALGPEIWPAFLAGVRAASGFLREGYYPLFRMTSVYAALRSLEVGPAAAMAAQIAAAAVVTGVFVRGWMRRWPAPRVAALGCLVCVSVSPYAYDYDLTLLGLAVALILPDLLHRASRLEMIGLTLLSWLSTGAGLATTIALEQAAASETVVLGEQAAPSLGAPALALLVLAAARILKRPPRETPSAP